jgi:hypothetical protein
LAGDISAISNPDGVTKKPLPQRTLALPDVPLFSPKSHSFCDAVNKFSLQIVSVFFI